ncbi:hypothetical protein TRV_05094, partial [Trichophyton verrucosum HKI 0517]
EKKKGKKGRGIPDGASQPDQEEKATMGTNPKSKKSEKEVKKKQSKKKKRESRKNKKKANKRRRRSSSRRRRTDMWMWMWMWAGKEANIVQKRGWMFAKKRGGEEEDTDTTARETIDRRRKKQNQPRSGQGEEREGGVGDLRLLFVSRTETNVEHQTEQADSLVGRGMVYRTLTWGMDTNCLPPLSLSSPLR